MKLSLIAGVAAVAVIATAAHAQYAAPAAPSKEMAPETIEAPTEKAFSYSLAAGADSGPITPPAGVPVLVMGNQTTSGYRGVAQVVLYRINDSFLEWTGLDSTSGSAITQGDTSAHGEHILWLDYSHQVDLEVNDGNTFFIHNASGSQRTGRVRLIY